MRRRFSAGPAAGLLTTLCATLVAAPASAQYVDVPTFQAGSPTFASSLQEIDVAAHDDGGFVVVWGEFGNTLGAGNRIVTHRFTRGGVETAPPRRIDTSGYGLYPNIVSDADGGFVGAWMWSKDGSPRGLVSRRLDAAASGLGSEFRVDTPDTGPMVAGAVAYREIGPVYFWKQNGLWIRAYDRFGSPLTGAIRVGDDSAGFDADIDVLPGGGAVVTWSSSWLDHRSWARIYDADLAPLGDAFPVDTIGGVDEVAVGPGGETVFVGRAFYDAGSDGGARGEVWLRRFSAAGAPLGDREVVRTVPAGFSIHADAAYDSRGNLLVVWREYDSVGNVMHPGRARAYDANGSPLGPDFAITEDPANEIQTIALADDCFATAWYRSGKTWANVVCLCGGDGDTCGDGNLDASCETCDDGNTTDGDGCDSNCRPTACGNGVTSESEQCDDGNLTDGDDCDSNCTPTSCGNGVVSEGEQCDDGNATNDDGCDANCRPSGCGNGVVGAGEDCDDGNAANGDGCDVNCTVSACGNGVAGGAETCDDGNSTSGDGCDANCRPSGCGNAVQVGEEECDDGNGTSGDGCDANCLVESCGNGRREDNEQCDPADAPESGPGACNPDCTLRDLHDSVVLPRRPVAVSIPVGNSPFTANVVVQVQNADVLPVREIPGHGIRLVAGDGDCPPGTVTRQPDFDRGQAGIQDTTVVEGGNPATAIAEITVSRETSTPFGRNIPERCTLWFTATEATGASDDPTPDNNVLAVALDVTDTIDRTSTDDDEFYVESMNPITVKIPAGQTVVTKQIKPVVRRSRDLPSGVADLEVTVSASDGDCPPGTVGLVDMDRRTAGMQTTMTLRRGRRAKGSLGLIVRSDAFTSPSDESPRRCTVLVTATGPGDTDPSNNTTRLVLDVIDRND